jgi:uncharacterized membrane protein
MVGTRGRGSGETRLETIISGTLIGGVVASLLLEAAGLLLLWKSSGNLAISHGSHVVLRGENFFTFLANLGSTAFSGQPFSLIALGIAILILTPYVRAVLSVIYFAVEKNYVYLAVTLFVLAVLTASLWTH